MLYGDNTVAGKTEGIILLKYALREMGF